MIRDITLGQYYPAKSVIHQLDPRVKLVATMLYVISLFVAKGILGYVIATIFLAIVIKTSKVPFKFITKGLKAIVMLLMITVVFNLFLIDGDVVLWHFGFLKITDKGLKTAVFMAIRLIYLIIGSSIMTLTTTPNDLTDGLEKLLGPLKKVHVPVQKLSR
jgi:energy-coupling factor transport system permease protein